MDFVSEEMKIMKMKFSYIETIKSISTIFFYEMNKSKLNLINFQAVHTTDLSIVIHLKNEQNSYFIIIKTNFYFLNK